MSQLVDALDVVGDLIAAHTEYKPNTITPATAAGAEVEARYRDLQGVVLAIEHGIASGVVLDLLDRPTTVGALRATGVGLLAALRDTLGRIRFGDSLSTANRAELASALDDLRAGLVQ